MSKPMISVRNLGKKYILRHQTGQGAPKYRRLSEELSARARRLFKRNSSQETLPSKEEFWALNGVSFDILEGEVVGIIGRNGAGKSTLLKLLSRITEPSKGSFELRGRVAALLEVGTGFHPELTGRENIFLNGAVLGMSRREIRSKFDEIVDFSGVEKFLDTPVKRFSSGMQTRLAFSVAAHLDPEILIIDEVLAVGDYEFQRRCLGKMQEVSNSGRTVLFVSHNLNTISTLTNRCIHLHKGSLQKDGATSEVIHSYVRSRTIDEPLYEAPPGIARPHVQRVEVITSPEKEPHQMQMPLQVKIHLATPEPLRRACVNFRIFLTSSQLPIQNIWLFDAEHAFCREPGIHEIICTIPKSHLFIGDYSLNVNFAEAPGGRKFDRLENICPFEVQCYGKQRVEYPFRQGEACTMEDFEWDILPPQPAPSKFFKP